MKTHLHVKPRLGPASRRRRGIASLLLAAVLAGCAKEGVKAEPPPVATKTADDRFAIRIGDRTVQMQLAVLQHELMQGLMYRQSMGADEGMLFIFARPAAQSFWM